MQEETPISKRTKRGSTIDPNNRFESQKFERQWDDWQNFEIEELPAADPKTEFIFEEGKSILSRNDSPDLSFAFGVNPYRGCEHGCTYCFARPTHEYLGMNAGIDFETKVIVKKNAPELLRQALAKKNWVPQTIALSGVTDCYQPAERRFKLTRRCLEVLLEARNPALIITKNILLLRDLDVLTKMAEKNLIHVFITLTSLRADLIAKLEPRTALPKMRLDAIRRLSETKVPVGIIMGPIIPGLTDQEIPTLLKAAADAGAKTAHAVLLRLPHSVKEMFLDWLNVNAPLQAARVRALIENTRGGALYNSSFDSRMSGEGAYAKQISMNFRMFSRKFELDADLPPLNAKNFQVPLGGNPLPFV